MSRIRYINLKKTPIKWRTDYYGDFEAPLTEYPVPSLLPSPTPTVTPSVSVTPTITPSQTLPTPTPTPSITASITPTATPTLTPTPSSTPAPETFFLLAENSDELLTEDSRNILVESGTSLVLSAMTFNSPFGPASDYVGDYRYIGNGYYGYNGSAIVFYSGATPDGQLFSVWEKVSDPNINFHYMDVTLGVITPSWRFLNTSTSNAIADDVEWVISNTSVNDDGVGYLAPGTYNLGSFQSTFTYQ